MMKKKALLTTLVLLSITQGSVYAEKLSSGIYDNLVDVKITDRQPAVTEVGEYTFNDGLKISSEYGSTQVNSAIISNATAKIFKLFFLIVQQLKQRQQIIDIDIIRQGAFLFFAVNTLFTLYHFIQAAFKNLRYLVYLAQSYLTAAPFNIAHMCL